MTKLAYYKGKLIDELTKEELIEAIEFLVYYYEDRLLDKDRVIGLLKK
jgi:hypothetical protein